MQKKRLLHYLEITVICFGFAWAALYPFVTSLSIRDLEVFLDVGRGINRSDYYYAPWIVPFYSLLALLPSVQLSAAVGYLTSAAGFLLAVHVFKGNKTLFFISYPFLTSIYWGQLDGVYAGSLAIMFLALNRKNDYLASFAWFIACAKFHIGIPLGFGLWWYFANDMRSRLRIVAMMGGWFLLTFIVYPGWLPALIERGTAKPPDMAYTVDLWTYTGPIILLLWIPVFLSRKKDYRWWVATWAMTVPYLHHHGLNMLLMVPTGILGWLVQINFLTGLTVSMYLQIIPAVMYLRAWRESWATDRLVTWWKARKMSEAAAQQQPV